MRCQLELIWEGGCSWILRCVLCAENWRKLIRTFYVSVSKRHGRLLDSGGVICGGELGHGLAGGNGRG